MITNLQTCLTATPLYFADIMSDTTGFDQNAMIVRYSIACEGVFLPQP